MDCDKVPSGARKVKKKQVKDELDRIKQAEKKKRRLEKALVTSAAICSELEMKKQKKKEEQQRLDDEGAAIAEAVALYVLLGDDTDDSCKVLLKKDKGFNLWDFDPFMDGKRTALPHQDLSNYPLERIGWVSDSRRTGFNLNNLGNSNWTFSPYFDEGNLETREISEDLVAAAQAVSSLRIAAEDEHIAAFVFDQVFGG